MALIVLEFTAQSKAANLRGVRENGRLFLEYELDSAEGVFEILRSESLNELESRPETLLFDAISQPSDRVEITDLLLRSQQFFQLIESPDLDVEGFLEFPDGEVSEP